MLLLLSENARSHGCKFGEAGVPKSEPLKVTPTYSNHDRLKEENFDLKEKLNTMRTRCMSNNLTQLKCVCQHYLMLTIRFLNISSYLRHEDSERCIKTSRLLMPKSSHFPDQLCIRRSIKTSCRYMLQKQQTVRTCT